MALHQQTKRMRNEGRSPTDIARHIKEQRRKRRLSFALVGLAAGTLLLGGFAYFHSRHEPAPMPSRVSTPMVERIIKKKKEPEPNPREAEVTYAGLSDSRRAWIVGSSKRTDKRPDLRDYPIRNVRLDDEGIVVYREKKGGAVIKTTLDRLSGVVKDAEEIGYLSRIYAHRTDVGRWQNGTNWEGTTTDYRDINEKHDKARKRMTIPKRKPIRSFRFRTKDRKKMRVDFTKDTFFGVKNGGVAWKLRGQMVWGNMARVYETERDKGPRTQGAGVYRDRLLLIGKNWFKGFRGIAVLNSETGETLWRFDMEKLGWVLWPKVDDGRLVVNLESGTGSLLLDMETGKVLVDFNMEKEAGKDAAPWRFVGDDQERYYLTNGYSIVAFEKQVIE